MLFRHDARIFSGCNCLSRRGEQKTTEISLTLFSFSAVPRHYWWVARIAPCFWVLLTPRPNKSPNCALGASFDDKRMTLDQLNFLLVSTESRCKITITMRKYAKWHQNDLIVFYFTSICSFWCNRSKIISALNELNDMVRPLRKFRGNIATSW